VHDGLGFAWNGLNHLATTPTRLGTADDADARYLTAETRGNLADSLLSQAFSVAATSGGATLSVGGVPSVSLHAPGRAFFQAQMVFVRSYADLRADRIGEIDVQIDDMLSFFGLVGQLDEGRRKRTLELLSAVIRLAVHVEMPFKHWCRSLRPIDLSPMVHPVVQTPDHSAFPSGHAMEAFAAATVLDRLCRDRAYPADGVRSLPFQIAHRIATNRTVAGVHCPVDSLAGALVGCRIGDAVWRMAHGMALAGNPLVMAPTADDAMTVGGQTYRALDDFTLDVLAGACAQDTGTAAAPVGVIGAMWQGAAAEWQDPPVAETAA